MTVSTLVFGAVGCRHVHRGVAPLIPVDAAGRLDIDLLCLHCGYNLRMQPPGPEGSCPECGAAVEPSVRYGLTLADRRWLCRLVRGLDLACWRSLWRWA